MSKIKFRIWAEFIMKWGDSYAYVHDTEEKNTNGPSSPSGMCYNIS